MTAQTHILLIDDEAIALSNLSHVLTREGYAVTACKTGEAGLRAMQTTAFDLVMTDLQMPGVDGMAVLRHVRANTPDIPVIMITGHATLDSAVDAMKAGAYHTSRSHFGWPRRARWCAARWKCAGSNKKTANSNCASNISPSKPRSLRTISACNASWKPHGKLPAPIAPP